MTGIEHVFYSMSKRYLCGSGRAWAARQRPVRLVTGPTNSVLDPGRMKDALRKELDVTHVLVQTPSLTQLPSPSICVTVDPTAYLLTP